MDGLAKSLDDQGWLGKMSAAILNRVCLQCSPILILFKVTARKKLRKT